MLLRPVLAASLLGPAACSQPAQEPKAAARAEPEDVPVPVQPGAVATISVTVTPSKLFVRGKPVAQDQLQARLEALAKRSPDANVAVQADANVAQEQVLAVVETIKAAGFSNVAVATRPVD